MLIKLDCVCRLLSQVGAAHLFHLSYALRISLDADSAIGENVRVVAHCQSNVHILLNENDREPLFAESLQSQEELLRKNRCEPQ